jgi:DNA-binding helix-hairpin-helix protein with protein kinase domain
LNGNRYRLERELGRGGQGAVFAVDGGRLAVKLLRRRSRRERERLRDRLTMVRRLPLEGLPLARPIELLRPPHVGYVMELLRGMMPLAALQRPPRDAASPARWYIETGGLRRRLRLLARLADALSRLHGRGLIYVDLSPNNVFVSAHAAGHEVRLIDTDNLRPAGLAGEVLYTPGYGAPELVRDVAPPSTLSDAHAFAVLAFETLALTHPLLGDEVRDGDPELEERALAGELPWIDHPEDDSNRSSDGIPRELVLSNGLRREFAVMFGAGLRDPTERPGVARWAERLHRAADRTVLCPECGSSYCVANRPCPWCGAPRPDVLMAYCLLWEPQGTDPGGRASGGLLQGLSGYPRVLDALVIDAGETAVLDERHTQGTTGSAPRLRLRWQDRRLHLQPLDDGPWLLVSQDGRRRRRLDQRGLVLPLNRPNAPYDLHAGPLDSRHRVVRFILQQRGGR